MKTSLINNDYCLKVNVQWSETKMLNLARAHDVAWLDQLQPNFHRVSKNEELTLIIPVWSILFVTALKWASF
jgi:hypothetical protein